MLISTFQSQVSLLCHLPNLIFRNMHNPVPDADYFVDKCEFFFFIILFKKAV